ncbi:MAG: hypothetical protein HY232_13065 [Acidobacteria bacterium]|nr:hypothetical protein [Acidobacteriota bacterium]
MPETPKNPDRTRKLVKTTLFAVVVVVGDVWLYKTLKPVVLAFIPPPHPPALVASQPPPVTVHIDDTFAGLYRSKDSALTAYLLDLASKGIPVQTVAGRTQLYVPGDISSAVDWTAIGKDGKTEYPVILDFASNSTVTVPLDAMKELADRRQKLLQLGVAGPVRSVRPVPFLTDTFEALHGSAIRGLDNYLSQLTEIWAVTPGMKERHLKEAAIYGESLRVPGDLKDVERKWDDPSVKKGWGGEVRAKLNQPDKQDQDQTIYLSADQFRELAKRYADLRRLGVQERP